MDIKEIERQESINYLIKIGCLIPFDSVELYHGRTSRFDKPGKEWVVDPKFNNASNNTGNYNVNSISVLSTAEFQTAKEFADARNNDAYYYEEVDPKTSQVIRIVSSDKNSLIFNSSFDVNSIPKSELNNFYSALSKLVNYRMSEMTPAKFEDHDKYQDVYNAIKMELAATNSPLVTYEILDLAYKNLSRSGKVYNKEIFTQIGGAYNARWFLLRYPKMVIKRYLMEEDPNRRNSISGFVQGFDGPLNLEYFASWCHNNHIIGYKAKISSATLGKDIDNYMIFDKNKINTEKAIGEKLQKIINQYGEIEKSVSKFSGDRYFTEELKSSDPVNLINTMARRGYLQPYILNSGVWEGFLVGEHTETVLRIFEDTYKDDVPESMQPFMRFLLLIHDIGKGYAVQDGKKSEQKKYTEQMCKNKIFNQFQIEPKMQDLILFLICESQNYVSNIYLDRPKSVKDENKKKMIESTTRELRKLLGREPTKDEIRGIIGICKIIIACDGGAYTRYAVTRDHETGVYYRNGNDEFTKSFDTPTDLRGREINFPQMEQ